MNTTEEFSSLLNPSEDYSNVQNSSEEFSNVQSASQRASAYGRGKKYPGAETPDPGENRADSVIMEEAYAIFERQGERCSVRMIAEYCKNGELVCDYDSDDKRWHITRESVENKIAKIKALNARKPPATPQSTSEHFSEDPAPPRRTAEEFPPASEATKKIQELEQDIFDLKVLNKSKDMYIVQLVDDREKLLTRVETTSRLIGKLKLKLFQLVAPEKARDIGILAAPSDMSSNPPAPNVSPNEPLADNTPNHYEHPPQESFAEEQR